MTMPWPNSCARSGYTARIDAITIPVSASTVASTACKPQCFWQSSRLFSDEVEARARIGARYSALLAECRLRTPYIEPHNTSVYAQYTIAVDDRDTVLSKVASAGIPTAIHYPIPLHRQPALIGSYDPILPVAEHAALRVFSLPMHPYLSEADLVHIAREVSIGIG